MQKTLKIKNEPYWWSDAKPEFVVQEEWPSNADVVIVGAGYTGLSAALTLLDSGLKVIIIDKKFQKINDKIRSDFGKEIQDETRYKFIKQ